MSARRPTPTTGGEHLVRLGHNSLYREVSSASTLRQARRDSGTTRCEPAARESAHAARGRVCRNPLFILKPRKRPPTPDPLGPASAVGFDHPEHIPISSIPIRAALPAMAMAPAHCSRNNNHNTNEHIRQHQRNPLAGDARQLFARLPLPRTGSDCEHMSIIPPEQNPDFFMVLTLPLQARSTPSDRVLRMITTAKISSMCHSHN